MRRDEPFGRVCAPGEVGELCVAGDGLAVGYLGDPELTARKFVTVPVDGQPRRLYRTGDLGSLGPDGVFHFHGRLDRQVKVRGHRLEPAGIERVADAVPGVGRCLVAAHRDGNGNATGLVLFYLAGPGAPTEPELTAALREALPGYSVPDQVVAVGRMPLSANGKVDVAALLAAHPAPRAGRRASVHPAPARRTVRRAGAGRAGGFRGRHRGAGGRRGRALLGLAEVDRSESVFALGGTSLTAVRLSARLGARFGRGIPVSQLNRTPTVAGLAAWLDGLDPAATAVPAEPGVGPRSAACRSPLCSSTCGPAPTWPTTVC
ncbi:non-ribosomal peptide synthetase [Streptacidiphilus sp. 4-A2]|nr:non-ribosomal peptide synthetase [Streptacidiphilus sp. 4-A2]